MVKWTNKTIALLLIATVAATLITVVIAQQIYQTLIPNDGNVPPTTSTSWLETTPTEIHWLDLQAGQVYTQIVTVTNNGTKQIVDMYLSTVDWSNSTDIGLTLDWNWTADEATRLFAGQTITLEFTLTVALNPKSGTFSFTTVITTEPKQT